MLSATDGIVENHRGTESFIADRLGADSFLGAIALFFILEVPYEENRYHYG